MGKREPSSNLPLGVLLGLGFSLFFSAMAGILLGVWLDRRTGSGMFAPIGLLIGLFAGIHRAWQTIRPFFKKRGR